MNALPFDVLERVTQLLPVQEILNLRATSKSLHTALEERCIWRAAVQAILRVVPSPPVSASLSSLSSVELRRYAARALHLDRILGSGDFTPHSVRSFAGWHQNVHGARVLPGGQHLLVLLEQRLELWAIEGGDRLLASLKLPGPDWHGNFSVYKFEVFVSAPGRILVLLNVFVHRAESCVLLCEVDVLRASIGLITAIMNLRVFECCLGSDQLVLITGSADKKTCLAHVYAVPPHPCDSPHSTIMKLPVEVNWSVHNAVSVMSNDLLLVHDNAAATVFPIPAVDIEMAGNREAIAGAHDVPEHTEVTAIYRFVNAPENVCPTVIQREISGYPTTFLADETIHTLAVSLAPATENRLDNTESPSRTIGMSTQSLLTPPCMGYVGSDLTGDPPRTNYSYWQVVSGFRWMMRYDTERERVQIETHRVPSDADPIGLPDFSRELVRNTAGSGSVAWSEYLSDLTFDEASGRMCMLDIYARDGPRVVIADILPTLT